jgi:cytoskeleton protein RodZ
MNLQEMGNLFREERERRGLSLSEVVERTKISRNNIEAIEDGKKERLPHPVYAKGFVKNYAGVLGLDPDDLVEVVKRELGREEDEEEFDNVYSVPSLASKYGNKRRRIAGTVAAMLLLAGLGIVAGLWYKDGSFFTQSEQTAALQEDAAAEVSAAEPEVPATPEPPTPPVVESAPPEEGSQTVFQSLAPAADAAAEAVGEESADLSAVSEELSAPQAAEGAQGGALPEEELEVVSEEALNSSNLEEAAAAAEVAEVAQAPMRTEAAPGLAPGEGSALEIRAKEIVWTLATIDGDTVRDFTLKPGQSIVLRFKDSLMVKFGNAGGVDLRLNGEDYKVNAASGQVKTLRFQ